MGRCVWVSVGVGDRRRLVASSVARRARQHLRPAFAVHAGARLTGTGKKDRAIPAVGVDAPRSSRRRASESGSAEGSRTPSTTISSSRRWARAPPRGAGRVPWASSLSSFLPRFRPRNGKRDFSFSFRVSAVPSTPRGHRQERRVRVRDERGPHADPRRVGVPAGVLHAGGSLKHCTLSLSAVRFSPLAK